SERHDLERDKLAMTAFAAEISRYFLQHELMPGTAVELAMTRELLPGITLDELNHLARTWGGERGRVIAIRASATTKPPQQDQAPGGGGGGGGGAAGVAGGERAVEGGGGGNAAHGLPADPRESGQDRGGRGRRHDGVDAGERHPRDREADDVPERQRPDRRIP